jgi:hypothetical protein
LIEGLAVVGVDRPLTGVADGEVVNKVVLICEFNVRVGISVDESVCRPACDSSAIACSSVS